MDRCRSHSRVLGQLVPCLLGTVLFVHGTRFVVSKVHTGARRHSTDAALQVVR